MQDTNTTPALTDAALREFLQAELSSAIRNSGDDSYIAEKANNRLRLAGKAARTNTDQAARVMAAMTWGEKRAPLGGV